jgi:hypothetical protein
VAQLRAKITAAVMRLQRWWRRNYPTSRVRHAPHHLNDEEGHLECELAPGAGLIDTESTSQPDEDCGGISPRSFSSSDFDRLSDVFEHNTLMNLNGGSAMPSQADSPGIVDCELRHKVEAYEFVIKHLIFSNWVQIVASEFHPQGKSEIEVVDKTRSSRPQVANHEEFAANAYIATAQIHTCRSRLRALADVVLVTIIVFLLLCGASSRGQVGYFRGAPIYAPAGFLYSRLISNAAPPQDVGTALPLVAADGARAILHEGANASLRSAVPAGGVVTLAATEEATMLQHEEEEASWRDAEERAVRKTAFAALGTMSALSVLRRFMG